MGGWTLVGFELPDGRRVMVGERRERPKTGKDRFAARVDMVLSGHVIRIVAGGWSEQWPAETVADWPLAEAHERLPGEPRVGARPDPYLDLALARLERLRAVVGDEQVDRAPERLAAAGTLDVDGRITAVGRAKIAAGMLPGMDAATRAQIDAELRAQAADAPDPGQPPPVPCPPPPEMFARASGALLDALGAAVGVHRWEGEDDAAYRPRGARAASRRLVDEAIAADRSPHHEARAAGLRAAAETLDLTSAEVAAMVAFFGRYEAAIAGGMRSERAYREAWSPALPPRTAVALDAYERARAVCR